MDHDCFPAHIRDLSRAAQRSGSPRFTAFLTPGEITLSRQEQQKGITQTFWGGWEDAERQMLCLHPDDYSVAPDAFPFSCVKLTYRRQDTITHRDLLGSVLGLGLKRELIGDLLITEGTAYLFVCKAAVPVVCDQLVRVGRIGVSTEISAFDGAYTRAFEEISGTVASVRLDAVVRLATNLSRERAASLILAQAVMKNGLPVFSASAPVNEGDILSIRGSGKFRLKSVSGPTKKGRLHLILEKYC